MVHDAAHDDGGGELLHTGEGGEVGVAELLVVVDVAGVDADEVVGVAEESFGVAHFGDFGERVFELGDGLGVSLLQGDRGEDLEGEAEGGGIDVGVVADDGAVVVEVVEATAAC